MKTEEEVKSVLSFLRITQRSSDDPNLYRIAITFLCYILEIEEKDLDPLPEPMTDEQIIEIFKAANERWYADHPEDRPILSD